MFIFSVCIFPHHAVVLHVGVEANGAISAVEVECDIGEVSPSLLLECHKVVLDIKLLDIIGRVLLNINVLKVIYEASSIFVAIYFIWIFFVWLKVLKKLEILIFPKTTSIFKPINSPEH